MRLLLPVALGVLLAGCGTSVQETSFATIGEELPSQTPSPSPTPEPVSGLLRVCEAFDIVTSEISPAYEAIAADTSDLNVQLQGLAIMVAGSEIADLADGVSEPEFMEVLERMGEGFIAEGERVTEGDVGSVDATSYYLDQVVEYGQECP